MTDDTLDDAYRYCEQIARRHYENFPTASRLLARPQRRATAAIYAFARSADDIADEGDMTQTARHQQLDAFVAQLAHLGTDTASADPIFIALADTIQAFRLPLTPFKKLLDAFRSDIDRQRFPDYPALAAYCDNSANPVGELVLRLHDRWDETNAEYSNQICTALQLLNFVQDLASDYQQRGRLYIPQDEMAKFGVDETCLAQQHQTPALQKLVQFQLQRAHAGLVAGLPLLARCHGRLRLLLKLTLASAFRIHSKLSARSDVYTRPTLHSRDIAVITVRSLLFQTVKPT
ncbi:MAG: squalene synthase HpnC [Gammaproteobacteria bacterium]|nr:squalene synthase HpnC [Gammaproteobacteria bacterium]